MRLHGKIPTVDYELKRGELTTEESVSFCINRHS